MRNIKFQPPDRTFNHVILKSNLKLMILTTICPVKNHCITNKAHGILRRTKVNVSTFCSKFLFDNQSQVFVSAVMTETISEGVYSSRQMKRKISHATPSN